MRWHPPTQLQAPQGQGPGAGRCRKPILPGWFYAPASHPPRRHSHQRAGSSKSPSQGLTSITVVIYKDDFFQQGVWGGLEDTVHCPKES